MIRHFPDSQRLFFTTDLRGADRAFRKVLNAGDAYRADVVVVSGNLSGTALIPIVKRPIAGWSASKAGRTITLATAAERTAFITKVADSGNYAVELEVDRSSEPHNLDAYLDEVLVREATTRLSYWLDRIAERGIRNIFMSCGNDDPASFTELIAASPAVTATEGRIAEIGPGRYLVTYSYSNPTPWRSNRELTELQLSQQLDDILTAVPASPAQLVFNTHTPPFDSELDSGPRLGPNLDPITIAGQELRDPVGSTAIRAAIERHQPVLSLHGRVLDSRGEARLGTTLAINPGSESTDGTLLGALIDLNTHGVCSHLLTTG